MQLRLTHLTSLYIVLIGILHRISIIISKSIFTLTGLHCLKGGYLDYETIFSAVNMKRQNKPSLRNQNIANTTVLQVRTSSSHLLIKYINRNKYIFKRNNQ